jgi:DUF1009 family protein
MIPLPAGDPAAPLALIAGAGRFPFEVAAAARQQGVRVYAVGVKGWVDPALRQAVDRYEELAVGELGRLFACFKDWGVRRAVMAGKVTKAALFDAPQAFDAATRELLGAARDASAGALLGALAARLARDGIEVLDSSTFLRGDLCPEGALTRRAPSPEEWHDIRSGMRAARQLAALDIGQTVVVKGGVIVAVEALEGTDAAIRRAREVAGPGLVVVKAAAAQQDRRFDLPVVGPQTVSVLAASGVSCLAMEAHQTLVLERARVVAGADAAGVCLIGVGPASG